MCRAILVVSGDFRSYSNNSVNGTPIREGGHREGYVCRALSAGLVQALCVPKSKRQTMDEKAQRLAAAGKLPGTGGTGTMSFDEYLSLPKSVRMKKMRKVLSQAIGNNKQDHYIPYLRQPVRSYATRSQK